MNLQQLPREIYPFDGKYFDVGGGVRLHHLDEGEGPPVVMVHGNPTWSIYYRKLVLALRGDHRCIVPDHVGCGLSDKPGDDRYPYTLARRVDDLEALLEHAGVVRDVTLVVHDWGGMIGMAWAARHPERVKRLVVLNTGAFHLPKSKSFPWPLRLTRTAMGGLLVRRFNAFSAVAARVCCKRAPMSPELRAAYCAPYDTYENRIATLRFVQDIPLRPGDASYDLITETEPKLAALRHVPMLIGWGMRDFVFDVHFLDEWQRRFPEAEVHRYEDCGHYILEDAADELIPLITRFVGAEVPARAAPGSLTPKAGGA
jgi:haloalkane dehalogenase